MAGGSREVAVAIGVGDAKRLPYLGGAVNGARAFHDWASTLGYESKLITDEDQPVTVARLRSELESMLKSEGRPVHRLLLYFAGHGLIREAEEGLWLLSDWNDELRAVAIEVLKRRLYMHDIQQIAIFADCCRSLPADIDAADLCPDPVLGRGPIPTQRQPAIDKFIAAQDGSATFMVPGATPAEDRCLFSGVLMEGLWGKKRDAFSMIRPDKVTSQSLGAYLQTEVPRIAESYKRKLIPAVNYSFPEGDDIYLDRSQTAQLTPPSFPDWPSPAALPAMGRGEEAVETVGSVDSRGAESGATLSGRKYKALAEKLRQQPRPDAFETGAGFAVKGGSIRGLWKPADVFAESYGQANWWRVGQKHGYSLMRSVPVLIEFEDGIFAATTALPGFIATLLRDKRGISALIYRPVHSPPESGEVSEMAIAQMESGSLRADAATDLAVSLRHLKHREPVLGVISAYLYDSIGDVDSIRRMAFYYAQERQPIPYDVALLAQLQGENRDGVLWARVPAVEERDPITKAERLNEWAYLATPETIGEVGGLWPWMRQGWGFLDDPSDVGSTLILSGLIELRSHLAPGRFTTFDALGGSRLAEILDLMS
jgi:hypothetical protein